MRGFIQQAAQHIMEFIMSEEFEPRGYSACIVKPRKCWNHDEWLVVVHETMTDFISALNDSADGVEYSWYWDDTAEGTEITIEFEVSVNWGKYDKPKNDEFMENAEEWVATEWDDEDTWINDHLCLDLNHGYCKNEGRHELTSDADWALFQEALAAEYSEEMYMRLKARLKEREGGVIV